MWLLPLVAAHAAPVDRGLQARVFSPAFDFAAEEAVATPISIGPKQIVTEYSCYFEIDVDNFNIIASMDAVDVTLEEGQVTVDIDFGTVIGYDITVAAYSGWLDLCVNFDATLLYLELENGHLTGTLVPVPGPYGMELQFVDEPVLEGVLDSDVKGFPDDLLWAFFSGLVKNEIEDALTAEIPTLVQDPISGVFASPFGDLSLSVQVADIEPQPEGLYVAADVDLGGDGDPRAPHILMEPEGNSHFAVALTDGVLQDLAEVTWGSGALDANSPASQLLLNELSDLLGLPSDVTMSLAVAGEPKVEVGADVVTMSLPGTTLEAWSGGERLLHLVADLSAEIEPNVEPALGSILLSAHEVHIDVLEIEAGSLVTSEEGEEHLANFLETWVADAVTDAIDQTPVFGSQFAAWGYVLYLDRAELLDKSIVAWFTVFRADDPEVDLVPPETAVTVEALGASAEATFGGLDDRGGELTWKWRIDGGAWSHWAKKNPVPLAGIAEGPHTVEAVSRDIWQNEDPTPASASFEIVAPPAPVPTQACGCASAGGGAPPLFMLALAAAARRRRLLETGPGSPPAGARGHSPL